MSAETSPAGEADSSTDASDKEFSCPKCGDTFPTERGASSHHAQVHGGGGLMSIDRTCSICGEEFTTIPAKDNQYCSPECGSKAQRDRVIIPCEWCDSDFEVVASKEDTARFCSSDCKYEWHSETFRGEEHPRYKPDNTVTKPCGNCGKSVTVLKVSLEKRTYDEVFCSKECFSNWFSENIRGADHPLYKDSEVACENCGTAFQKRPAKIDAHEKQFCSRECHGEWLSKHNVGENHPRYKGGTHRYYGPSWYRQKRKALERDNRECQACGATKDGIGQLPSVHHIVPFRKFGVEEHEEANRLDNLVCLCPGCHSDYEGLYLRPDTR